jgi:hypothetical protein
MSLSCLSSQAEDPAPPAAKVLVGTERGWVPGGILGLGVAEDLGCIVAATGDGHLLLLDKDGTVRQQAKLTPHIQGGTVVLGAGGKEAICLEEKGPVLRVRSTETGKELAHLDLDADKGVPVTVAAQSRVVVLGYADGTLVYWDRDRPQGMVVTAKVLPPRGISCSSDGRTVAILTNPREDRDENAHPELYVWQPERERAPQRFGCPERTTGAKLSPSGKQIAIQAPGPLLVQTVAEKKKVAELHIRPLIYAFDWAGEDGLVLSMGWREQQHLGHWSLSRQEWVWHIPVMTETWVWNIEPRMTPSVRHFVVSEKTGKVIWIEEESLLGTCDLKTGKRESGWAGNENPLGPITCSPGMETVFGWKPGSPALWRWDLSGKNGPPAAVPPVEVAERPGGVLLSEGGEWAAVCTKLGDRECTVKVVPLRAGQGEPWERTVPLRWVRLLHLGREGHELLFVADTETFGTNRADTVLRLSRRGAAPAAVLPQEKLPQQRTAFSGYCGQSGRYLTLCFTMPPVQRVDPRAANTLLQVWDLREMREIRRLTARNPGNVLVSETGDWLLTGQGIEGLSCYDLKRDTMQWVRKPPHPIVDWTRLELLSRDEHLVVSVVKRQWLPDRVEIRETATGVLLCRPDEGPSLFVRGLSRDNTRLFVYDASRRVRQVEWQSLVAQDRKIADLPLARCVEALANPEREGYAALLRLAQDPKEACRLIGQLPEGPAISPKRLEELITELRDNDFDKRNQAQEALKKVGPVAEPALRAALAKSSDLDQRKLLTELLEAMPGLYFHPAGLRDRRLVHLLENMNHPEARRLLESFAAGDPLTYRSHYAKDALRRLQ